MTVLVAALLRAVFRVVDGVVLLARPALWRAWWVGWRGLPSPYAAPAFAIVLDARRRGADADLVYGEAFVVVARGLLRAHGVGPGSVVADLGCGRGAVLLAARSLGAQARGLELNPAHLAVAGPALRAAGAIVDTGDARAADVTGATHVWLSWATWSGETRSLVRERLRALTPGSLVFGVVHGVDDAAFELIARARAPFSWGLAEVVVSRKRAGTDHSMPGVSSR
jgi:SAM-dependent methyltransferase